MLQVELSVVMHMWFLSVFLEFDISASMVYSEFQKANFVLVDAPILP